MNQKSFEEKKKHADGKSSSFIGSFIWGDNTTKNNETTFKENLVSFENLVKDCQIDLVEWADCIINKDQIIESIEVTGEVRIKAKLPGDHPRIQVKLSLPEEYEDVSFHPLCISTTEEDSIYRMGN